MRWISPSEIKLWQTCKRKWFYKYKCDRVEPVSRAMSVGVNLHSMLEKYLDFDSEMPPSDSDGAKYATDFIESEDFLHLTDKFNFEKLEEETRLELTSDFGVYGFIDAVCVDDSTKTVWILDWKTGKKIWEPIHVWHELALRTYALSFWENNGVNPGVIVQSIRTVDREHPRSKPPFYGLSKLPTNLSGNGKFPESLLKRHKERLIQICSDICEAYESPIRVDHPSRGIHCGWCSLSDACDVADSGDKDLEWSILRVSSHARERRET